MSFGSRADHDRSGRTVELAHFWAAGDGRRMLTAVLEEFAARHGTVEVREQSYENHGLAIKSRILQENPPSVFVEWPDQNLVPYSEAGALRDVTDLWEANGWEDAFVEGVRERSRIDGAYVGVPVDIHRMNNLFYRVDLVEQLGVDPDAIADPRELVEVLEQCEGDGVVGMSLPMKNPQTVLQFWATVFIGQFGAEAFESVTAGNARAHKSEIRQALEIVDDCWRLASDDATFVDMVEANDRFVDGESAFFTQGDWMAGEYADVPEFEYGTDWGRADFPGTAGVYMLGIDLIAAAESAPFHDGTRTFLEFMGSTRALEVLNRVKGSIPPRQDVPMDDYPQFLREQYRDFKRAREFPAGHALQVTPDVFIEARTAFSDFLAARDVEKTTGALVEAY